MKHELMYSRQKIEMRSLFSRLKNWPKAEKHDLGHDPKLVSIFSLKMSEEQKNTSSCFLSKNRDEVTFFSTEEPASEKEKRHKE